MPTLLAGAVPVQIAIAAFQEAVPGEEVHALTLSSTPEVSIVPNIEETTIETATTTWESGEATFIRRIFIWTIPVSCSPRFHLSTRQINTSQIIG